MSWWSYVHGTLIVEPAGRTQAEKEYVLKTVLAHLPIVDGSEGPMKSYINMIDEIDSSANHDEFFNHSNLGTGRHSNIFNYHDRYIVSIHGDLRDTTFSETYKSIMKWLHRLSKRVLVTSCMIRVTDFENQKIFNDNGEYLSSLYEYEDNWCDYLLWDYNRDSEGNILTGKPKKVK